MIVHGPIGNGSCSLPLVTGACMITLPSASITLSEDSLFDTRTEMPGTGLDSASETTFTFGTTIGSPGAIRSRGFNRRNSAGDA